MRLFRALTILSTASAFAACGGDDTPGIGGGSGDDGGSFRDAGVGGDASRDAQASPDSTTGDAGTNDSSTVDTGVHDSAPDASGPLAIAHVLLLSIDGMHEADLANYIAAHPASALAKLAQRGVHYTNANVNALDGSPTNPTDSFPGLLALTTGGSSPTTGGWYDVSYARELYPDATCTTPGTMVSYDEGLDVDHRGLWGNVAGGTNPTHDPKVVRTRLNTANMPFRKAPSGCWPVYPHSFIRVNTIFEVAHAAGLHTAWSDKHPAYEMVTGPSGGGLDDFFAPEINSLATNLPGTTGAGATDDFTTKWTYTEVYDDLKVGAILNQIAGKWSDDGLTDATDVIGTPGVPAIFGMNFQAVSVSQKDARTGMGGYTDAVGTPNTGLADALAHTDASIGKMIDALTAHGLLASTLVVVTAKHGQSPIDHTTAAKRDGDAIANIVNAAAPVVGHIEDDVALYWLANPSTAAAGAAALLAAPTNGTSTDPNVDTIYTSASTNFVAMFGDPTKDPRTPDLVVKLKKGTIYSLSTKKWSEHGGFADDDAHVALLVSHPAIAPATVSAAVRTKQVAPTILAALGLDPTELQAVQQEATAVLPGLALAGPAAWTPTRWTAQAAPVPVTINGGPWSLAQLAPGTPNPPAVGTTLTNVSYGYCATGARQGNTGVALMQPYYFPMVIGSGNNLQGFFDWRPKDINEAIVAAKSTDNGLTWTFQQEALDLTQGCPVDSTKTNPNAAQADNGFGHPYVFEVGGIARLYALDRSDASIDNLGLAVTSLTNNLAALQAQPAQPLAPAQQNAPSATDGGAGPTRTTGLMNPDGIVGVVPGSSPVQILYVQKQKGADNTGTTALPLSEQCSAQPYLQPGATTARKANHDIVTIRLASTTDGIAFTDLGAVSGLSDTAATSYLGTRYTAPNGTILKVDATHYGLFFSGGNCIDADSDGFHYVGYAESTDLKNWTIVNGIQNPIASLGTNVVTVGGEQTTIPARYPVVGPTLDWFKSRVYSPSVVKLDNQRVTITFAGYSVQSPNADLLHYRQIGHVVLTASRALP